MHNLVNLIRFIEHVSCKRKIKTTIAGHVEWPNIKSEVIKFPMWYFVASEKVGFSITDRNSVLARWQGTMNHFTNITSRSASGSASSEALSDSKALEMPSCNAVLTVSSRATSVTFA